MELDGTVAVVTRGTSGIAVALAERFAALGSIVVLSDKNEEALLKRAFECGATGIAADTSCKAGIRNLIDKAIHRFGRIDLFVSNASFAGLGNLFTSEKDWNQCWQSDTMAQMYAARYTLPQMIRQRNGYLLNMMPATGLFGEFQSELYSTLTHPSLSFAKRMATNYRAAGIKVSVFCSNSLPSIARDSFVNTPVDTQTLRDLADTIVTGVQQEQFMIVPDIQKTQARLARGYHDDRIKNLRA
jgi:NAD(P)-dependent dehydrogenase (short-subunit alcohol dehydrogenase family)